MKRRNSIATIAAIATALAVSACSFLNEKVGPEVESCADLQGPSVCKDDIIAFCDAGQIKYVFCEDTGQKCILVNEVTGHRCGCLSDGDCSVNQVCREGQCVPRTSDAELKFVSINISSDDNGDGKVNKGERIGLNIEIENSGTRDAGGVTGVLSTTDSYVTMIDGTISFGDVFAVVGESKWGGIGQFMTELRFDVSESVPPGHTIEFILALADEGGNSWNLGISIPVEATGANLVFQTMQVTDDDNGDGLVNKGERIGLNVEIRNAGTSDANGVAGVLSTTDSYVTMIDGTISFGDVFAVAGESKWGGIGQHPCSLSCGMTA